MTLPRRERKRTREPAEIAALARLCAQMADDKKGEDIVILDLRGLTAITDFFVIVTAGNPRQMKAIAESVAAEMKSRDVRAIGMEGADDASRWVLLDFGDFVLHLFDADWRHLYDLELLWGDAPRLEWTPATPARPAADA